MTRRERALAAATILAWSVRRANERLGRTSSPEVMALTQSKPTTLRTDAS